MSFVHPTCGVQPVIDDYRKPNGAVRWHAFNRANRKFKNCVQTAARQDPANVAARADATAESVGAVAGAVGDIGAAYFGQQQDAPEDKKSEIPLEALLISGAIAALFFGRRSR